MYLIPIRECRGIGRSSLRVQLLLSLRPLFGPARKIINISPPAFRRQQHHFQSKSLSLTHHTTLPPKLPSGWSANSNNNNERPGSNNNNARTSKPSLSSLVSQCQHQGYRNTTRGPKTSQARASARERDDKLYRNHTNLLLD